MRAGGGKQKGSAFEREICKALSLWVTDGKKADCYWRSAMSGGRATVHHRRGSVIRQSGDITAVAPEGHALTDKWFIECKHVKKLDLDSFLLKGKGALAKFWKTACEEAKKHQKDPMIIARQNGPWPIIVLTKRNHIFHWVSPQLLVLHYTAAIDITLFSDLIGSNFNVDNP